MAGGAWVSLVLAATCCALSSANFRCSSHCNVGADLHCSVQATNIDCLSTAFSDSHNWPGKPEHLNIQSHSVSKTDNRGFVGVNITWRTPSDVSATYVTGFEVSLNLIGSNVFGVRTCYVFNLTRATNTSRVILQELVDSVFTLQCQVPAKAEGIFTQLYSLPKPKKKLLQKRVYKYFKFEAMRATASPNPCDADPQIKASVDRYQAQIIVKLRNWQGLSKYIIRLMKGSYEFDQQTIQPGNGSGIQQATFGDPKNIQPGECYNIWVNMESCETTWVSSLKNSHCIPETPSPITPPVIFTETIPVSSPEPPPSGLSVTVVAVLVIIIVLILCLVFIAVYRRIRVCPTPYAGINDSPPDIEEEIPIPTDYRHDEIRKLVFFYCLSRESKKCVQEFEKFLKLACGEDRPIEFIDFVNQDEIDINTGSWITNLVGKIDERGCHLLVIYSSGLVHLFEAENDGMCYPGYMNKEHNGEYVISFFKRIRDDLLTYNSHRGKERVISLGSKYTNAIVVARSLANFSGYKPMLLSDNSGRVSVNMLEMCEFLESLGIAAPKEALKRIDTGPLERAVEEMLSVEKDSKWFRKRYGNPQKRSSEVGVEKRYSSSSDASASDIGPQEQSSSGFGTASYGDQYTDYVTVSQPSHLKGQSHNLLHEHRLNNQCLLSVYPPCEQTDKDNGLLPADSTKPGFPDDWDPVAPRLLDEDSHV